METIDYTYKLLELDLCKVNSQILTLEGNEYSNQSLDKYQKNLFKLFEKVSSELTKFKNEPLPSSEFDFLKNCLYLISLSVQFLEDSVLNTIPYETVYCLEKALKEWTEDDFTFVTSLQRNQYAFDPSLSIDPSSTFQVIKYRFAIQFEKKLIQICIPKHEVNDYFFSIVLYHELAHYIDLKFKITESLLLEEEEEEEEEDYQGREQKENHLREYFADVFSSQYISDKFLNYLEYNAIQDGESITHPSTSDRMELIEDFVSGDNMDNKLLNDLKKATKDITGKELKIRHENINGETDFFDFIPPIIENDKQLHGLLIKGWDIWINERDKYDETNLFKIYTYINNLIEKSISNYMVQNAWDKQKSESDVSK